MASDKEMASIELPAPVGWKKLYTPGKGGTAKNSIVFITPSGEELTARRQLDQYLKSHPGGPQASEFDWGTGETPRRSARIEKRNLPSIEKIEPKKRARKPKNVKKDDTIAEAASTQVEDEEKQMGTEKNNDEESDAFVEPSGQENVDNDVGAFVENTKEAEGEPVKSVEKSAEAEVNTEPLKEAFEKNNTLEVYETGEEEPKAYTGVSHGMSHDGKDIAELRETGEKIKVIEEQKAGDIVDAAQKSEGLKDLLENKVKEPETVMGNDEKNPEKCTVINAISDNNENTN